MIHFLAQNAYDLYLQSYHAGRNRNAKEVRVDVSAGGGGEGGEVKEGLSGEGVLPRERTREIGRGELSGGGGGLVGAEGQAGCGDRPVDRPKFVVLILAHGESAGGDGDSRMGTCYYASVLQPHENSETSITPMKPDKGHITIGPIPEMMDEANIGAPSRADLS